MAMTQAASLERKKIQAAIFAILGQDYKTTLSQGLWDRRRTAARSGKGRGYYTSEQPVDEGYWMNDIGEKCEDIGFEHDDTYEDVQFHEDDNMEDWGYDESDAEQGYHQHEDLRH